MMRIQIRDRRTRRSLRPDDALRLLCDSVAADCGLDFVIVARGAQILLRGGSPSTAAGVIGWGVGDYSVLVAGANHTARRIALRRVRSGVRRIL